MKQYGYIVVSRKLFETDPLWNEKRPRTRVEAWLDLIQMAAWKPCVERVSGVAVKLARGQFAGSLHSLADRWMWNRSSVRRFLIGLGNDGKIVKQHPTQHPTQQMKQRVKHLPDVYLIVKYDTYQGATSGSETASETADETATETVPDTSKEEAVKQLNKTTHGAYEPDFELIWAQYPSRTPNNPKGAAYKAYSARLRQGVDFQTMFDGTVRYAAYAAASGIVGTQYVMHAATFYGPQHRFAESWESPASAKPADPLGEASSTLRRDWLVKMGYASPDQEDAA